MTVFQTVLDSPAVRRVAEAVRADGKAHAAGLWGSATRMVVGGVAQLHPAPTLLITAHAEDAEHAVDDLEAITGVAPTLFPQLEALSGDDGEDELAAERLRVCIQLNRAQENGEDAPLLVASVQSLMQPVPKPELVAAQGRRIAVGERIEPAELADWLQGAGFTRCDQVELPGDYAHRGGIVDVFGHAHTDPVRIEFFDDEVESLRLFDAGTQRSNVQLGSVQIPAWRSVAAQPSRDNRADWTHLPAYLPDGALIALAEASEIQELGRTFWQQHGERLELVPVDNLLRFAQTRELLELSRFAGEPERSVNFDIGQLPHFDPRSGEALETLRVLAETNDVVVLCENVAEQRRFAELLKEQNFSDAVRSEVGAVHAGFVWGKTAFVPHHELLSRARPRRTLRKVQPSRPIDSFFDLEQGSYVVHVVHGIGRFLGLKTIERSGRRDEYLAIEFADSAVVHVSASQIHLVQKYVGTFRGKPKLSKLGGTAWKRTKERVAEAVTDLAAEMLRIQAERASGGGIAYPHDTRWQQEFEEAFPYTETNDQLLALRDIKKDLTAPRSMDRLLCGDVGFGKTEMAIRAAFKVIEYGKQVAVLVPTTVLADQHYHTFSQRLADYPFSVDVVSRFRSKPEQAKIIERAKNGQLDILIGTHRLLSKDVRFADLGLVIIDEEQRFGVEAKERLKHLRSTVEVLTLSATPIPRTLHMSLLGIRDISSLATPPVDRRAIVTQVRLWDDQIIRQAILRELSRDGQVYFVHNFVHNIEQIANQVRTLVPEARVVVGHGQMKGPELEEVMLKFVHREADVLVSTNIIESGIDIPSANTIFINRAERFGLADLHQLRGRVGRSKHRAYCYLMLSPKHPVKELGARRLKAIEQYSELGAGFQIAMRDLEIRGAGNILGPEQSGHIEAVGYEMYCQLLEQAVRRMKNEPAELWKPVNVELGITASIPRAYIRSEKQRMEVYKRLASAKSAVDVDSLREDLRDAFGAPPTDVATLLTLAELRVLAQPWGIRSIVLAGPDVVFMVEELQRVDALFASGPGSPRMPDPETIHWRLPQRLRSADRIMDVIATQLRSADPGRAYAAPAEGVAGKL